MAQKGFARIRDLNDLGQTLYLRDFEFLYSEIFQEIQIKGDLIYYLENTITFRQNQKYIIIEKMSNSTRLLIDSGGNFEIEIYLGPEYKISYNYPYLEIRRR